MEIENEIESNITQVKKYSYLYTGKELLAMKQNTIPYLWEPFLISQGLAALVGSSDVGKSSFLRQLAISIALKKTDFLGFKLNVRYGRAIYFSTEDNQISINALLKKQIDNSVNPTELEGLCYIFNADNPLAVIEEQLIAQKTDVVIIDAYSDIFSGNMNDNGHTRKFLNEFEKLASKYDCLFVFLHHTGKRTELNTPNKNNIIGSQGFEAKMRVIMDLRKQDGSNNRILQITKGNYLADSQKMKGTVLSFNDKQEFENTGQQFSKNQSAKNKFDEELKTKIMIEVDKLLKKNLSLDNVRLELLKMNFNEVPAKSTLHNWVNEKKESSTNEN